MPPNPPVLLTPGPGATLSRGKIQRFVFEYSEEPDPGGPSSGNEYPDISGATLIPADMSVNDVLATVNNGASGEVFAFEPRANPIDLGSNALLPPENSTLTAQFLPTLTDVDTIISRPIYETVQGPVYSNAPSVYLQGNANNIYGAIIDTQNRAGITVRGLGVGGARYSSLPSGSYANRARGIKGSQNGSTIIVDCLIENNENQGVGQGYLDISYTTFKNNGIPLTIDGNGNTFFEGAWGAVKTTRGILAQHNYIADTMGHGLWLDCTGDYLIATDNVMEYSSQGHIVDETSWTITPTDANGLVQRNWGRRAGYKRDNTIWTNVGHKGSGVAVVNSKYMRVLENHMEFCEHACYISTHRITTFTSTRAATGTCGQGYQNQSIAFGNNSAIAGSASRSVAYSTVFTGTSNSSNTTGNTGSGAGSEGGGDPPGGGGPGSWPTPDVTATTAAQIKSMCEAATAGQVVGIADGTYNMSSVLGTSGFIKIGAQNVKVVSVSEPTVSTWALLNGEPIGTLDCAVKITNTNRKIFFNHPNGCEIWGLDLSGTSGPNFPQGDPNRDVQNGSLFSGGGENCKVMWCRLHDCANHAVGGHNDNFRIEHSEVFFCGSDEWDGTSNGGVKSGDHAISRYNLFRDNHGNGIWVDTGAELDSRYDISVHNTRSGIKVEDNIRNGDVGGPSYVRGCLVGGNLREKSQNGDIEVNSSDGVEVWENGGVQPLLVNDGNSPTTDGKRTTGIVTGPMYIKLAGTRSSEYSDMSNTWVHHNLLCGGQVQNPTWRGATSSDNVSACPTISS